eukprot:scaffold30604_cov63-Phaeocystis_antarctica.AAC.2
MDNCATYAEAIARIMREGRPYDDFSRLRVIQNSWTRGGAEAGQDGATGEVEVYAVYINAVKIPENQV